MREISTLSAYKCLSPGKMANTILHCPKCGRDHSIPFKFARAGENLITKLPGVIYDVLGEDPGRIGVVYDRQIEYKLEGLFFEPFSTLNIPYCRIPLGESGKLLEAAVDVGDHAAQTIIKDVDFLLSVGSGVISDLTKWMATKRHIPYLLMGTAASMNAYTSITGSMTEGNVKTSKWLDPASGILLDSDLLASAPVEMTCAGIADLLARNVANADWKLSEITRGTYFCPVPYQIMTTYQDDYLALIDALGRNDRESMKTLGNAVLVSGYSMTLLNGETSPSSGSEHVISHFFDFQHEVFGLPKNFHGTQVGIGTIIMSTAFEILRTINPSDLDLDDIERCRLSQAAINLDHRRVFGSHGREFDAVVENKRIRDVDYRGYIAQILDSWPRIWEELDPYLMSSSRIREVLERAGAVTKLAGVNRTSEDAIQALFYGSHYRSRYTVLDLFWELGLFPAFAHKILMRSKVLE